MLALSGVVASCNFDLGIEPPRDRFYFPTGVLVSPGRTALYVVSSDFDLQFTGGTVLGLELGPLREAMRSLETSLGAPSATVDVGAACSAIGLSINPDALLEPGPCSPVAGERFLSLVRASAAIGAFGSGGVLVGNPDGPGLRLFVPVRGDPSITYLDVADDRPEGGPTTACPDQGALCIQCGGDSVTGRCSTAYALGTDPSLTLRGLEMPVEPFGIAAAEAGAVGVESVVATHQLQTGAASLVVNRWDSTGPSFEFVSSGLLDSPTEVVALPTPAVARYVSGAQYLPGFLLTYRNAPYLDLLRFDPDSGATPARPFLSRQQVFSIGALSSGADSRGIAIDGSRRAACEEACDTTDVSCLRACAAIPHRLFVASRSPVSLLVGEIETVLSTDGSSITSAYDVVTLREVVPLSAGPSRVVVGNVVRPDGSFAPRAFVAAFDSRAVYVYDPDEHRIETVIRAGRGPQSLAIDAGVGPDGPYAHLYVAQFTDSYVSVVSLDQRAPVTYGKVLLTVGEPAPPREEQ